MSRDVAVDCHRQSRYVVMVDREGHELERRRLATTEAGEAALLALLQPGDRVVLEATGGFDERLGAGTSMRSGEDTDLLVRASLLGFEGRYDPRVVVYHHHRRQRRTEVKQLYSGYAYGRGALSMKTILESKAKTLYLKNWYWRMRILLRERKFNQCFNEIKGAIRFIAISKF